MMTGLASQFDYATELGTVVKGGRYLFFSVLPYVLLELLLSFLCYLLTFR